MSTSYKDYLYDEYIAEQAYEAYQEELAESIDKAIDELPIDNIRYYLGTNGDAIESRVKRCLDNAKELIDSKNYGPSLVVTVTAIEIIIRFFILRPLVQDAFLSDSIANMLIRRILPGQTARDRELLPAITKHWDIPLTDLKLSNGNKLWDTLLKEIIPKRNDFVHKADIIDDKLPVIAMECVDILMKDVIAPMSKKFDLGWPDSGSWHKFESKNESGRTVTKHYTPSDPFKR